MNYDSCDCSKRFYKNKRTFNINAHFIAPNPPTSFNKKSVYPTIDDTAYVGPFSSVIGNVIIEKNVFIAPTVSIRADEGSPFYIDTNTNIQDGVVLHGLAHGMVIHENQEYSIYIGKRVSCGHGCMVHGPCKVGNDVFIGFHSIVFNCIIGDRCYISTNALVTNGVTLRPDCFVPSGAIIDTQEKANNLFDVPKSDSDFAKKVQYINQEFPQTYSMMFGKTKCSCGLACSSIRDILE